MDTPEGKWYAIQFQDSGAVGRIPCLMPVTWQDAYPVFGDNGKIPEEFPVESTRPGYAYAPLAGSDDFKGELKTYWEFNHEPDFSLISHDKEAGTWQVRTDKVCGNLLQARNTLTQRMLWPGCAAEVTVDGSGLREGDYAGLCALQGCFGFVGLARRNGQLFMVVKVVETEGFGQIPPEARKEQERAAVPVEEKPFVLKLEADFSQGKDVCSFYYKEKSFRSRWQKIGQEHRLRFGLDHFCGCRFGLAVYSTKEAGGSGGFSGFAYYER